MNGIFSAYPKLITRFLPFQVMRSWCGHSRERTCSTGAISGMCVWLWQDIRKLQAEKCYEINNFVQDCSISASMYFLLCDNHLYVKIDLAQPNFRPNDISIEFEIRPKYAVLWFKMNSIKHNDILHTTRQYNCCGVCKVSSWSVKYTLN